MRLLICGDTVPMPESFDAFRTGDVSTLFGDVLPVLESADRVVVNLECALTEKNCAIPKFGPNLKGPVESAQTLRKAGITDCGLANNHMFDFGLLGMQDTINALESVGINWFGAGETDQASRKPLIINVGEKTCAILAVSEHEYNYALPDQPGAAPFVISDTLLDIIRARNQYDYVIVTYHGGKEYCRYPSPRLHKVCRAMVECGADLVLCQHSHIIGCMERYLDGAIIYGQGNFHFSDEPEGDDWTHGLIVDLTLGETVRSIEMQLHPVELKGASLHLLKGEEKEQLLSQMHQRDQKLINGEWREEWHNFCEKLRSYYENTVYDACCETRARELFCHYLDCVAHHDVYCELFETWHKRKINECKP